MPHFHHFSICNQNQSISNLVIFTKIPRLQPYFWPKMPHFHHFSICNQNQSISNLVIFHKITRLQPYFLAKHASFSSLFNLQSKSNQFQIWSFFTKLPGYSLTFWPKMPHFHHFSICNQNQSISNLVIFHQNTKAIALLFGQKCLIFITFQSAIKFNQFQIWSFFTQNTKAIALLFGQKCLIFITFQSEIKINQFQIWSFFTKIPRLQPYCLAKNASFHHFSICNLESFNFNLVIFHKNTRAIALLFAKNASFSSLFNLQSNQSISNLVIFHQNTKAIALLFGQKCLSFSSLFNLQSKSSISNLVIFHQNHQGYSITLWPKMPHFHHFSICNQNQSISNLVIFHQNTKAIALLFGLKCLIFITFQSAIKINQFQIWSFFTKIPRLQPYCLAKMPHFHHFFNLQSKSNQFQIWSFFTKIPRLQPTVWPKMPHFHHFSICNQNQSISNLVIFHQNTKAIALVFW